MLWVRLFSIRFVLEWCSSSIGRPLSGRPLSPGQVSKSVTRKCYKRVFSVTLGKFWKFQAFLIFKQKSGEAERPHYGKPHASKSAKTQWRYQFQCSQDFVQKFFFYRKVNLVFEVIYSGFHWKGLLRIWSVELGGESQLRIVNIFFNRFSLSPSNETRCIWAVKIREKRFFQTFFMPSPPIQKIIDQVNLPSGTVACVIRTGWDDWQHFLLKLGCLSKSFLFEHKSNNVK